MRLPGEMALKDIVESGCAGLAETCHSRGREKRKSVLLKL